MSKLAFIGDRDVVEGFAALGASSLPVGNEEELEAALDAVAKGDYSIVFITEHWAERAARRLEKIAGEKGYPVAVIIPDTRERLGIAEKRLQEAVKIATGRDTFSDREELSPGRSEEQT